ncbi:hypothetical protein GCM10009087_01120 [Sphingomonas oligophenolica]
MIANSRLGEIEPGFVSNIGDNSGAHMDVIDMIDDAPIQTTISAIFFSMELSRSTWLVTSLSPGAGDMLAWP